MTGCPCPARRSHPLALPPEEPAATAAPASAEAEAQVTAGPPGDGTCGRGEWKRPARGMPAAIAEHPVTRTQES